MRVAVAVSEPVLVTRRVKVTRSPGPITGGPTVHLSTTRSATRTVVVSVSLTGRVWALSSRTSFVNTVSSGSRSTVTVRTTVCGPERGESVPQFQPTALPTWVVVGGLAATRVTPAGKVSVSQTSVATSSPVLVKTRV